MDDHIEQIFDDILDMALDKYYDGAPDGTDELEAVKMTILRDGWAEVLAEVIVYG